MKKSYLFLFFILLNFALKSQTVRVDYENSSKWFFGLNMGGTWNTTDVKNKTNVGWGMILGKSYGFNAYSPITIDLRARYLRGYWYGQDSDTSFINAPANSVMSAYNNQGMTVQNFQADVHRLAMELALHLNGITKRTGWDPYIFGGIGLTWHQVNGNLYNQNDSTTSFIYDYASMLNTGTSFTDQLTNSLDEIYDTPLDGYNSKSFNVAFMPSLGFGLGYHIGKRTTFGIEHKTTFTLRDDFDGLTSNVQSKKDRYHYTSLYLRFRFRGKRPRTESSNVPCYSPQITIIQPSTNSTVTNPQFTIEALVSNVRNSNQISVVSSSGGSVPFQYNSSTNKLFINTLLIPGQNTFTIRVNNSCGSDSKVASINYLNCNLPTAIYTNPSIDSMIVRSPGFTLTAAINGITDLQGVKLYQNNVLITGYSFNVLNGLFQSNVTLAPGINTFTLQLFNGCGSNSISTNVNFNNCVSPSISLTSPSATGTTVNNASIAISAALTGITAQNQIAITQNNLSINQFTLLNNRLSFNTTLATGINTFTISTTNACGNSAQTFTVNYQTCNAPIITLENPSTSGSNATASNLNLKAKIVNIDSKQNVLVSLNGLGIKNTTFTKTTNSLEAPLTLQNGANTITITASNSCGADVETSVINYNPCVAPVVNLGTMSNSVTSSSYTFSASILNQPINQGISLTLNGSPINYSYSAGNISSSVNLQTGANIFALTVINSCGNTSKTWTVNNSNCTSPSITLVNPSASGTTINSSVFAFKVSVTGMTSNQGISLTLNGNSIPVAFANGLVENNLTLLNGANTIKISASNACGNDSEDLIINFQNCTSPTITINQPINQNTTVNQSAIQINASVMNVSNSQNVTVKLNGIGVSSQFLNNVVTSNINLKPGANTILISATNDCGTDVEAINLNYNECFVPQVSISNSDSTTSNSNFMLNASVSGTNVSQGLTLTHNGNPKSYTLNGTNLTSNIILTEGVNIISISAVNLCGSDVKTYTIKYKPCLTPVVAITNPASSNLTINTGSFTFQGQITNVTSANEISLSLNGNSVSNFSISNGQVIATVNLITGQNTFKLSANTSCGNDMKSVIITGKSCDAPVISATASNVTVSNSNYSYQANVTNVATNQGINLSLNGINITNFTYANGSLNSSLNLTPGQNSIVLIASNECGNVNALTNVNYQVAEEQKITICHIPPGNPNNPQTIEIPISAWPAHQAHGDVMGACVPSNNSSNGNSGNGGTNDNSNNNNVNGENSSNGCLNPVITLPNLMRGGIVVSNPNYTLLGSVANYGTNGQISVLFNNSEIPVNIAADESFVSIVTLNVGINNFTVSTSNNCGSDSKSLTVELVSDIPENNQNNGGNDQNGSNSNPGNTNSNGNGGNLNGGGQNNNLNGNNGHGNNADGVDSSNPGQGSGGPNGQTDQSGNIDDENSNGGNINTNSNNGSNSSSSEPNTNSGNQTNNGNENTPSNSDTLNINNGNNAGGNGNNSGSGNNVNGNNGHGNNADGVDSSNPGQGSGGPNGQTDQSGTIDDENSNGGNPNNSSNGSNSSSSEPNTNSGNQTNNGNENNTNNNGNIPSNSDTLNIINGNNNSGNGNNNGSINNSNSGTNGNGGTGGNGNGGTGGNGNGNGGNGNGNGNQKKQNNGGNTRGGSKPVVNPVKPNENKTNDSKPNPQIKPEVKPSNPKPNDQKPQVNPGVKRGGN